jgi:hypothetical protein
MIIPLPGSFMKRIALAVSLVALVFAVSGFAQTAARPKGGSVEQEIIKLEKEWMDAWLKQDAAFIDRILADDYTPMAPSLQRWKTLTMSRINPASF